MLLRDISDELSKLTKDQLFRSRKNIEAIKKTKVLINGIWLINFASNDYLGISQNKIVQTSIIKSLKQYGNGSGASHLISGHFDPHYRLEKLSARTIGMEKALFFSTWERLRFVCSVGSCVYL